MKMEWRSGMERFGSSRARVAISPPTFCDAIAPPIDQKTGQKRREHHKHREKEGWKGGRKGEGEP